VETVHKEKTGPDFKVPKTYCMCLPLRLDKSDKLTLLLTLQDRGD
jgi:hypothetical protein